MRRKHPNATSAMVVPACGWVLIAALAASIAGAAEPEASGENGGAALQVTVEAQRAALEHRLSGFVRGITSDPRFYGESLPRWRRPVCFAVSGLAREQGEFALQRLSEIARSAHVALARRPCEYNFFVVFSAHPDQFLKQAFHLRRRVFDDSQGLARLRRFVSPPTPQLARAWHNANLVSRNGAPIDATEACVSVTIAGKLIPVSCQYAPSRIEWYDVFEFSLALVVIDTSFARPAKLGQIVDLAALIGLADIDLDEDIGAAPSILCLPTRPADAPSGLTSWDQAFFGSL